MLSRGDDDAATRVAFYLRYARRMTPLPIIVMPLHIMATATMPLCRRLFFHYFSRFIATTTRYCRYIACSLGY